MLGRNTYTAEELEHATTAIEQQLAAYRQLTGAIEKAGDPATTAALEAFEPLFLNNLLLALDRYFVHRVRAVSGKDGNPLNEVELMTESLLDNDAILRGNKVIKLSPEKSVLRLGIGDRIQLTPAQFERLSTAFLAEIKTRFR